VLPHKDIEFLWSEIKASLEKLASQLVGDDCALSYVVGRYANDTFPLRAYLSLTRVGGDDEVAVTIDLKIDGDGWQLDADICSGDGRIFQNGPCTSFRGDTGQRESLGSLSSWIADFQGFLSQNVGLLRRAVGSLSG
jgi:hypothetical protein